jgi:Asp-tRNA(Asn)/Glu-tRNA(Gln) amidotransferase A subunit family amidase
MPNDNPVLADLLRISAQARKYPFLERAALWEERLAMHVADLETLSKAPTGADMLTLPPKAKLEVQSPASPPALAAQSDELTSASAREIAQRIARKDISVVEVAQAALARAEAHRHLNAFITLRPERVLEDAKALDARIAKGEAAGPLAGVPVAVKDLMYVRGYPFTCGTRAMDAKEAQTDAAAVARLKDAGALIVGTANLHELAYGVTSANAHFGVVQNPTVAGYVPGGSSGGSGAAVAAGLAAIGVGTDTGGSIRIPAACCGVVGFKPTHEAVSREGCWPLADTLDTIGPLTRDVEDAVIAFEVMAGLPPGCIAGKTIERPRLIKPTPFFYEHLDADIRARVEVALKRLERAGASLAQRTIDSIEYVLAAQFITICAEGCQSNWELLSKRGEGISPDVRLRLEVGQFVGAIDYVKAQRLRRRIRDNMIAALKDADVLVVPTLPIAVPKSGTTMIEFAGRTIPLPGAMTRLTGPFSATGMPVCSIAVDKDSRDLPVSVQFVGRPGADATVLAVARWAQHVLAG